MNHTSSCGLNPSLMILRQLFSLSQKLWLLMKFRFVPMARNLTISDENYICFHCRIQQVASEQKQRVHLQNRFKLIKRGFLFSTVSKWLLGIRTIHECNLLHFGDTVLYKLCIKSYETSLQVYINNQITIDVFSIYSFLFCQHIYEKTKIHMRILHPPRQILIIYQIFKVNYKFLRELHVHQSRLFPIQSTKFCSAHLQHTMFIYSSNILLIYISKLAIVWAKTRQNNTRIKFSHSPAPHTDYISSWPTFKASSVSIPWKSSEISVIHITFSLSVS